MDTSLIVTIAVVVFLLIFLIIGIARGFLRVLLSVASLAITLILASTFAQPVAKFADESTSIGSGVSQKIEDYINSRLEFLADGTGNAEERLIDTLPLPADVKEELLQNYNLSEQVRSGTETFAGNIAGSLSSLVLRILSFILLFIVILLVLRLIMRLSNLINHIPVLGGINRFLGAGLGLAEGAVFLWVACLIIMMLSGTPAGNTCETVIRGSKFLTFVYEHNYLMAAVNAVLHIFHINV